MRSLERGRDKIKQLSDILKRETLEPAGEEREALLKAAREEADSIVEAAKKKAAELESAARGRMEKERSIFHSSLQQACKQSIETLRQSIESTLFHRELAALVARATSASEMIGRLLDAVVEAIEREGIRSNLTAVLPSAANVREVNEALLKQVLERLGEGGIVLDGIAGGVQVKLVDELVTLDMSAEALTELFSQFLRKDFRSMLFEEPEAR